MPYAFASTERHRYRAGGFFLGLDQHGQETGLTTERHLITVAGSRSGKGAALIIPNLLRWRHNVLCIDPKGENAEQTWQAREDMGQRVYVLDPFRVANVPDRLRTSCNLLATIQPDSLTAREDIRVIADGMVMRHKAEDATWDNGAVSVLSGMIAYVCDDPEPSGRNLHNVRRNLTLPPETLSRVFEDMAASDAFGGLCKAAAAIGLSDSRKNREFVGGAIDHSEWLDSPAMAAALSGDGFNLSELKTGKATVYLVLPPQYLGEHGRFLRLFVRAALDAMAKGSRDGERCLFLLDEFFALGHIDQIAKAAGMMPGYGVQLWPFLQDLGQLQTLYGDKGAGTFFGNADAHIFFGNTDAQTLGYVSGAIGRLDSADIGVLAPRQDEPRNNYWSEEDRRRDRELKAVTYQNERAAYDHAMRAKGDPRLTPQEIRELVAKRDGDKVARSMIVFAKGGDVLNLRPEAFFENGDNRAEKIDAQFVGGYDNGVYKLKFPGNDAVWFGCTRENILHRRAEYIARSRAIYGQGFLHRLIYRSKMLAAMENAARMKVYADRMEGDNIDLLIFVGNATYVTVEELKREWLSLPPVEVARRVMSPAAFAAVK